MAFRCHMEFKVSEGTNLMATPTFTYGNYCVDDCNDTAGWTPTNSADPLTGIDFSCPDGDCLKITGTCDAAADEYVYYTKDVINVAMASYPKCLIRWKTSAPSDGLIAKIVFEWTVGDYVYPLGFSETYTTTVIDLSAYSAKTLHQIHLYADDDPDALAAGTFSVFYDFIMFYDDIFTFPDVGTLVDPYLPPPRMPTLKIPGLDGELPQYLGADLTRIHVTADMNLGDWGTPKGKRIYQVMHEQSGCPFMWVTFPEHGLKFKGYIESCNLPFRDGKMSLDMWIKEYKLGSASTVETYAERFGH